MWKKFFWAYSFCIVLGWIGAHRFYLGRPYSGFVYALTGGIAGIGVVADLVLMPFLILGESDCDSSRVQSS